MDMVLFDYIIIFLVVFPFSREDNYNSKHIAVIEVTLAGYKNLRIMEIINQFVFWLVNQSNAIWMCGYYKLVLSHP